MAKKKIPTEEFIKEIQELFQKHNWSGNPVGLTPATTTEATITCVPPSKPHIVSVWENGKLVKKTYCL